METIPHFRRSKWAAMAASVWIQCTSGSSYCFGVYSTLLKSSQSYDQSTLDSVAFFKDAGANIGVISGLLYSSFAGRDGPMVVLAAGAIQCFAGYFLMWLSVTGAIPRPPSGLMCFFMLLAAHSQTFFNTADVVTAVENFPSSRGTVVGIMKGFLGLSGAIIIEIYRTLLNGNPASFLLMLALLPSLLPLLLMSFVKVHDRTYAEDDLKHLNVLSFIAFAVAAYLTILIIGENLMTTFQLLPIRILTLSVLLLFLLSPLITALKARPECFHDDDDEIRLIEAAVNSDDMNVFQAIRRIEFWLLFVVMACAMGSGLATVNNISQIGSSLGYTDKETNTLISLWSIWNFVGRFGGGYISDYFLNEKGCARTFFIVLTVGLISIGHAIISSGSLHSGSVIVGVCYGSQWSLMPTITSELFGLKHFGTIFNTVAIASPVGSYLLSVRLLGYLYDRETGMEASCRGRHCFFFAFLVMAFVTTIGFAASLVLYYRTREFYRHLVLMRNLS